MKRICEDDQVSGLEALIGEDVLLLCANYFYHGELVGLSESEVELEKPGIVYETGEWSEKGFADRQALPGNVFVRVEAIESYIQL